MLGRILLKSRLARVFCFSTLIFTASVMTASVSWLSKTYFFE